MSVQGFAFTAISGGGAGAMDAEDGAGLLDGAIAVVTVAGVLSVFRGNASSGATANGTTIVAPVTNAGDYRWLIQTVASSFQMPVGSIIPLTTGYFANGTNGTFTDVLGDSDAEINAIINPLGWYLCNGAALNLPGSPIFDGAGRYLPKLDDNRIPMGAATIGTAGGSATHVHSTATHALTVAEMPEHDHDVTLYGHDAPYGKVSHGGDASLPTGLVQPTEVAGGGDPHGHGNTGSTSTLQPYLTMKFIIRVI